MIDFLKDANITDDTIIEIMKNNNEASLFNLSCNDEDAIQIINYMRGIGITNIDELLFSTRIQLPLLLLNIDDHFICVPLNFPIH